MNNYWKDDEARLLGPWQPARLLKRLDEMQAVWVGAWEVCSTRRLLSNVSKMLLIKHTWKRLRNVLRFFLLCKSPAIVLSGSSLLSKSPLHGFSYPGVCCRKNSSPTLFESSDRGGPYIEAFMNVPHGDDSCGMPDFIITGSPSLAWSHFLPLTGSLCPKNPVSVFLSCIPFEDSSIVYT